MLSLTEKDKFDIMAMYYYARKLQKSSRKIKVREIACFVCLNFNTFITVAIK